MKLVVGNLKMNIISLTERDQYFKDFKKELKTLKLSNVAIALCVPALHLESFTKKLKSNVVSIGLQNIFWEEKGSFTGEISSTMGSSFGAEHVIIGHSERRKYFHETNLELNLKIKSAIKNRLKPIYCVGETKEEKENETAAEAIIEQITQGFSEISAAQAPLVTIAYEPVWAVGSDKIPTSDEILEVKILLKKIFSDMYDREVAEKIKVLYGGSVKADTARQVCIEPGMDGVLIGRESLVPKDFFKIVSILDK